MIKVYKEINHVDILAIGIHPDDVELSSSGTILSHIDKGYTAAICDLKGPGSKSLRQLLRY